MNRVFVLLFCSIISTSLSGCILSRSIIYINSQQDSLVEIQSASIDNNKLTFDYTVRRSRSDWAHTSVSREIKTCSHYFINKDEIPFDVQYKDQGIIVVPWKDTLFKSIPDIKDKDNSIVFDGEVRLSGCSYSERHMVKPENQVNFIVSQEPELRDNKKTNHYSNEKVTAGPHYFFFAYKEASQNKIHIVGLESPNRSYTPWYGPLLALTLPVAFAIDIVAFPIELMFYGEGTPLM